MLGGFFLCFESGETAWGDGVRGFAQQLLDSAKVATEIGQRLRESLVRRYANAFLLQGSGGVEHRAPAGHSVDAMFDLQQLRLHDGFDLLTEFRDGAAAGFVRRRAHAGADLLVTEIGAAMAS